MSRLLLRANTVSHRFREFIWAWDGKGVRCQAKNTKHGATSSVFGMSKSFSSFVASLSFNHAYIEKRNANRCGKTTGEGMKRGWESFSSKMFNDGIGGFIAGVGKEVVGAIDLFGKTSEGKGSSTNTKRF
ncbi:hypothetical protein EIN_385700 [Entamoeba invadens IP1]|uniref:Uncharacterized protein n=1 Tax=Entamoeba invadens IP1 TaxID=370355 RepID=L7FM68_ENTIV|nr:hypothetical protein EIN_385700 [Entamoeba invadens IP1]ELP85718.1 hypothetical protein EIN_385700 [Entamoeba invadens IP1]|eukprot:XP_004185064.1 hypothetical protein EIN_385700 [Entamoeba invadens IP1]